MNYNFILWGRKPNDPDWKDDIITETVHQYRLQNLIKWAKDSGYIGLRIMVFNNNTGEFVKQYKV